MTLKLAELVIGVAVETHLLKYSLYCIYGVLAVSKVPLVIVCVPVQVSVPFVEKATV